ncbi:MAG: hypothetical protein ACOYLG_13390 [Chitinophagaceae bacterium]
MERKDLHRYAKVAAMAVALASSIYAYNDHDGFYFTSIMAGFISIVTGLLVVAYWPDPLLRILSGTVFLCGLNNLFDETMGDPYVFGTNEKIFTIIITTFTARNLYDLYLAIRNGTPDPEQ